jgi:hypothetical protein
VTDQRDETGISNQQDDDEGMGGQDIGNREPGSQGGVSSGTDWTMGPGNTGTDPTESDHGGSADNDGGTSGDYVGGGSEDGNSR